MNLLSFFCRLFFNFLTFDYDLFVLLVILPWNIFPSVFNRHNLSIQEAYEENNIYFDTIFNNPTIYDHELTLRCAYFFFHYLAYVY